MKIGIKHIIFSFFLLVFLGESAHAQRKKKEPGEVQASATRLREAEFYFTEGEKFFILEDYAKALSYYQKTLEIAPDNATVHYKIAEVLVQNNRPEDLQKASLSIDNALRLEKKNKYFYLLAANIYTSLTRFDKAAQVYEAMINEVPGTEEYLYELAAIYQFGNKLEEAIRTYQRAEKLLGINEVSSLQKQRIFVEQGKIKEAITEGERLLSAFPGDERLLMGFTEFLSQQGMKEQAIQYLEKFTEQNGDAFNTKMLLAAFYRENNQEQKARPILLALFDHPDVEITSKLLILGAYNAELSLAKAGKRIDEEKFSFAEILFRKLISSSPEDPKVHIIGGDLYISADKPKEAHREYSNALEKGDVTYEVWENLLALENQLGYFDQLIRHSDQALEIFPNQGMLHFFNGCGHLRKNSYDEAISSFEQAKRLSSSNFALMADINGMLGETYHSIGNYDKSDKAFEDALAFSPGNTSVLNNYSYFLALRKTNLDKAEKMAEQLVKTHPENAAFLDTYAWVLYSRGKLKEAKRAIEKAIITGNATAIHFEHFGDILYKLGEIDAAVVQWEKAQGLNANNDMLNKKIANRKIYE